METPCSLTGFIRIKGKQGAGSPSSMQHQDPASTFTVVAAQEKQQLEEEKGSLGGRCQAK